MARCSMVCFDFSQIVEELNEMVEENVETEVTEETDEEK